MTGLSGWLRRHLILSIILGIILIFCLGSVAFALTFYRDKAAPGVTIANVKVGGRTKEQISTTVSLPPLAPKTWESISRPNSSPREPPGPDETIR